LIGPDLAADGPGSGPIEAGAPSRSSESRPIEMRLFSITQSLFHNAPRFVNRNAKRSLCRVSGSSDFFAGFLLPLSLSLSLVCSLALSLCNFLPSAATYPVFVGVRDFAFPRVDSPRFLPNLPYSSWYMRQVYMREHSPRHECTNVRWAE